ncbi:hypothetical protein DESC_870096 [Desulfosarcina cetonica]|nr:hypothetical protein DESC_870096 [Desulfosarcina cetonica]
MLFNGVGFGQMNDTTHRSIPSENRFQDIVCHELIDIVL